MLKRQAKKIDVFQSPRLDEQVHEIVTALDFWLGIQDSDPDTSNWGTGDFFMWVNNATPAEKVLKYWDGDAIKTITAT